MQDSAEMAVATDATTLRHMANGIRFLSMDAVEAAKSGHPGMPMGMADVATVLFSRFMKFDPVRPDWPDRDRFVLSAGHGSMLLYSVLHLTGYADFPIDELKRFRQIGSKTAGHPEFGHGAGIETTTGPLGQGLATAVGMALGERILNARFGSELCEHYTYTIAGDGCLMEGVSQEAISLAGHLKLNKLIVLWDDNRITIDGSTDLSTSEDMHKRFEAAGWATLAVDGHDSDAVAAAIGTAQKSDRPTMIACRTTIGYGAGKKAGTAGIHGSPVGAEGIAYAREHLAWSSEPFVLPDDVTDFWKAVGRRGAAEADAWADRLAKADSQKAADWKRMMTEGFDGDAAAILAEVKVHLAGEKSVATRKASQTVIDALTGQSMKLIGGSADLSGSNLTKAGAAKPISAEDYTGNYIYYGVREHGMAALMNGLSLHGGFVPFGGTFLCFTDYARPAMRLSALMGRPVIYVMTHDSIGQGEDGPTHQPIEHLASLRAMPNMNVFRPADGVETAECWELALAAKATPSTLVLTRQGVPTLRTDGAKENRSAKGAYVIAAADGKRDVTILATGSEVGLAVEAKAQLAQSGINAAVVSMPSWELFQAQPKAYRDEVLGSAPRVAVEAASPFGWARYVESEDDVVGMTSFGASAPGPDVYAHFNITAAAVADKARAKLGR
ncbi:transketolase [Aurantimonas marianensis]|uniref:Transketolase n=1 Tax=Aurantimonas marianensis TaxID=2920428 RepID=A0A9X2KGD1_9HYPH|nr:transketolase [Aurantimonas marianensis]MCP3056709.1 transketolase [Aurantimonas marianensis]